MTGLDVSNWGLVVFFILAITLFLFIRGARHLLSLSRINRSRRDTIERVWPVAEGLLWLFFIVSGLPLIFVDSPSYTPFVVGIFIVGLVWFARAAVGDFVDGVFLRASQAIKVGDQVTVEGQRGAVRKLGYRALTLETRDGDEVAIPYSRMSRDTIIREAHFEGAARHPFHVHRPDGLSAARAHGLILRAAMDCHWSSVAQAPRVDLGPDGRLEVTVFALDAERGPDIERAVRVALSQIDDGTSSDTEEA